MASKIYIPLIKVNYNPNLLSTPIFIFNAEYLLKIVQWLEKKLLSNEFHKYPATVVKIRLKIKHFMELYERAKDEERQTKEKTFIKANAPFYRPRLSDRNDQRTFEKLNDRRKTSEYNSRNIKV